MSFSVPSSPLVQRKTNPVTPRSATNSTYRSSPASTYSPYTPLSLRSATTSATSSAVTTPGSAESVRRLSWSGIARGAGQKVGAGRGDVMGNWRMRAGECGIRVGAEKKEEEGFVGDDEASDDTLLNGKTDEAHLLPSAFLSTHRRTSSTNDTIPTRPRAQSHATLPTNTSSRALLPLSPINMRSRAPPPPISPLQSRKLRENANPAVNSSLGAGTWGVMSTPPPNRTLVKQLKLKGSFTDPAQTRRREGFGARTPAKTQQDTSLDLFDIDENDFEYEYNGYQEEDSFTLGPNPTAHSENLGAYSPSYPSYPQLSPLSQHQLRYQQQQQYFPPASLSHPQLVLADPFHPGGLGSIAESVEQHFHAQGGGGYYRYNYDPVPHQGRGAMLGRPQPVAPAYVPPVPMGETSHHQQHNHSAPKNTSAPSNKPKLRQHQQFKGETKTEISDTNAGMGAPVPTSTDCSVCLTARPGTLAILIPCGHPLCSGCLTSALNIVGEKDMECAVCKRAVGDFKLVMGVGVAKSAADGGERKNVGRRKAEGKGDSFLDPLFSSPGSSISASGSGSASVEDAGSDGGMFGFGIPGIGKVGGDMEFEGMGDGDSEVFGDSVRASTPCGIRKGDRVQETEDLGRRGKALANGGEEGIVVLRIDNVPWDITPPQIARWLQQPVERVHVLLDSKGKTMSHAYVEVRDKGVAGAVLRGEAQLGNGRSGKKERGSVLGKGRRARGVTITRSGQEELMADLFPNWCGTFDGARPSLAGLDGERVIEALEGGLMSESEVAGVLFLIREPDSHFLKVPSLPFHVLLSILSKFPADIDSRVFWSAGVRDMLYDVTYAAVQVLLSRVDQAKAQTAEDGEYNMGLVADLVNTAMSCRAFTAQHVSKFAELAEACGLPVLRPTSNEQDEEEVEVPRSDSGISAPRTPDSNREPGQQQNKGVELNSPEGASPGGGDQGPFVELAREFGVEAQLVQALAQRLAGLH